MAAFRWTASSRSTWALKGLMIFSTPGRKWSEGNDPVEEVAKRCRFWQVCMFLYGRNGVDISRCFQMSDNISMPEEMYQHGCLSPTDPMFSDSAGSSNMVPAQILRRSSLIRQRRSDPTRR